MSMRTSCPMNRGLPFHSDLLCRHGCRHGGATMGTTRCWVVGTGSTTNISVPSLSGTGYWQLTLDNDILTRLLVPLTAAAEFVSQTIALMVEGLAVLTMWDMLPQLVLDK